VILQLVGVLVGAVGDDDKRSQAVPEVGVLDSDDCRFQDVLSIGEQVLDFERVDVLATGDDHVVVAAVDEEEAVGVEVSDVAGREKSVDTFLVTPVGVSLEAQPAGDEDSAE
jgi:hypothetical protein